MHGSAALQQGQALGVEVAMEIAQQRECALAHDLQPVSDMQRTMKRLDRESLDRYYDCSTVSQHSST